MKQGTDKPRASDFFNGTKSVARVLETMGFEVVTVDKDPTWHPEICVDVLQLEFWSLPRGQFQVIFASPPCTEYSQALTTRPRDLQAADALVWRTLKIIRHFCPQQWFVENPRKGKLSSRPGMKDYPRLMWIIGSLAIGTIRNLRGYGVQFDIWKV